MEGLPRYVKGDTKAKKPKLPRGAKVRITFELGAPQQFDTMLWSMRERAAVGGPMTVEIDDVRQEWWDQEEADARRRFAESQEREQARAERWEAIVREVAAHPAWPAARIADDLGVSVSLVQQHQENLAYQAQRAAEKRAIDAVLDRDPSPTLEQIAAETGKPLHSVRSEVGERLGYLPFWWQLDARQTIAEIREHGPRYDRDAVDPTSLRMSRMRSRAR